MKSTMTFLFLLCSVVAFGQEIYTAQTYVDEKSGDTHLIGITPRSDLEKPPYKKWYDEKFSAYNVALDKLSYVGEDDLENIEVQIFMGTWCGDSKKAVPEMYKVLDNLDIPSENISLVNVSAEDGKYKQSPTHEEKNLNVHRVPTFLFYRHGEEIGRIVETPATSLEIDLVQILKGFPSAPNYKGVTYLNEILNSTPLDTIDTHLEDYTKKLGRMVKGNASELNTYAFVLLESNQIDKAIMTFKLNAELFSTKPKAWINLADAYVKAEKKDLAKKAYTRAIKEDTDGKYTAEIIFDHLSKLEID